MRVKDVDEPSTAGLALGILPLRYATLRARWLQANPIREYPSQNYDPIDVVMMGSSFVIHKSSKHATKFRIYVESDDSRRREDAADRSWCSSRQSQAVRQASKAVCHALWAVDKQALVASKRVCSPSRLYTTGSGSLPMSEQARLISLRNSWFLPWPSQPMHLLHHHATLQDYKGLSVGIQKHIFEFHQDDGLTRVL